MSAPAVINVQIAGRERGETTGETHEEQGKFTISRSTYMGLPFIMSAIERGGGGEVFMEK